MQRPHAELVLVKVALTCRTTFFEEAGSGPASSTRARSRSLSWKEWRRAIKALGALVDNRAGQAYDATTGRVANYGEVAGPSVYFTACGSFTERDASVARSIRSSREGRRLSWRWRCASSGSRRRCRTV